MKDREKYEDRIRTQLENNHWNMMNDSIFKFIWLNHFFCVMPRF